MRGRAIGSVVLVAVLVVGGCNDAGDGSNTSGRAAGVQLEFSFEDTAAAQTAPGLTMKQVPDQGIEFVPGARGNAIRFDGSGAQIRVHGVGSLPIQDGFTLEFWFRPEGHNPVRKSSTYTCAAHSSIFYVSYEAFSNRVAARVKVAGKKIRLRGEEGAVTPHSWQHVALTYDGREVVLYLDGKPTARAAARGAVDLNPKRDFVVGTWHKTNQAFYGAIDELRLLDRALSADEVLARTKIAGASPR